jgi:large subunit ribosomal protein L27
MAHTKQSGKTRQHATRPGKRLGVKIFGGQSIKTGQIIVRQRGSKFHAGSGVGTGSDHTLFALANGTVNFKVSKGKKVVEVA